MSRETQRDADQAARELFAADHAVMRRLADELATAVAAHRSLRAEMERVIAEYAGEDSLTRLNALRVAWQRGCAAVDASLARVGIRVEPRAHEGDEADRGPVVQRRVA